MTSRTPHTPGDELAINREQGMAAFRSVPATVPGEFVVFFVMSDCGGFRRFRGSSPRQLMPWRPTLPA
jgi:hypothetical protein